MTGQKQFRGIAASSLLATQQLLLLVILSTQQCSMLVNAALRQITFSGHVWYASDSGSRSWGPGPNRWSPSTENLWVDSDGYLHIRLTERNGTWFAAAVRSSQSFGYGRYEWDIHNVVPSVSSWDPNAVLGLFTWSDQPEFTHREIDVEVAKWSIPSISTNSQYVVQPWHHADHLQRFLTPQVAKVTHTFTWRPTRVEFLSTWNNSLDIAVNTSWSFVNSSTKIVPQPGDEKVRINLWITPNGTVGTHSGQEIEVVISAFRFIALDKLQPSPATSNPVTATTLNRNSSSTSSSTTRTTTPHTASSSQPDTVMSPVSKMAADDVPTGPSTNSSRESVTFRSSRSGAARLTLCESVWSNSFYRCVVSMTTLLTLATHFV